MEKKELMENSLRLVDTIASCVINVNASSSHEKFYTSHEVAFDKIIEYAVKKTIEMDKEFEKYLNSEVYLGDVVTILINNEKKRYLLTKDDKNEYYLNDQPEVLDFECPLILELIGRHVGDTFTYSEDDEKNQYTITILATRRTEDSIKVSKDEIEAYFNLLRHTK